METMKNIEQPATLRKERKIPHLTLDFPVTAKIGSIGTYRFDASGLHLIRVLHECMRPLIQF